MPVDSPEDLYGLPLPRFIPEREALVKALRSEKRSDAAAAAAKMRKPSVAAWAVNQLVRTKSKAIPVLFQAGDDLARAQAGAASGKRTAEALREASRRQRDALDDLMEAAKELLSPAGHPLTAPTLERVADTLRAASIDGASRQQVAEGCLSQELRFAGMGIGDLAPLHLDSPPAQAAKTEQKGEAQRKTKAARQAEAARRRKAALTLARQTEAKARRAATRAEKELAGAQARREEAAASLEEAVQLLTAAAKRAEQTAAELKDAEQSLGDLTDA